MAALSTHFLSKREQDLFTYQIREGEVFPLVVTFDGFRGEQQSGYIPILPGELENLDRTRSRYYQEAEVLREWLISIGRELSDEDQLREAFYVVFKKYPHPRVTRVLLFVALGYEYLGNRTFRATDIRTLRDVIEQDLAIHGESADLLWSMLRDKAGVIAFDEVAKKNHEEAMLSIHTLNQVVVPLARIEVMLIQEALMWMSGGIIFSRILSPIFSFGYKIWQATRVARGVNRFAWLTRSFMVIQKTIGLMIQGLSIKGDLDTFKKIAEQIFILFDATDVLLSYQQAAEEQQALLLDGVEHLMDETEALVAAVIGLPGDQLTDLT